MKKLLLVSLVIISSYIATAQTTAIPDPNFEQALIDLGYDNGSPNGSVPTSNINSIQNLYIATKYINNFSGIQDFTA